MLRVDASEQSEWPLARQQAMHGQACVRLSPLLPRLGAEGAPRRTSVIAVNGFEGVSPAISPCRSLPRMKVSYRTALLLLFFRLSVGNIHLHLVKRP